MQTVFPYDSEGAIMFRAATVYVIEKVIDGDTIRVICDLGFDIFKRVVVRLNDIDCPEKNTPEGRYVRDKVIERLGAAEHPVFIEEQIIVYSKDWTTSFNRTIGDLVLKNQSMVGWLLEQKYARPYHCRPDPWSDNQLAKIRLEMVEES